MNVGLAVRPPRTKLLVNDNGLSACGVVQQNSVNLASRWDGCIASAFEQLIPVVFMVAAIPVILVIPDRTHGLMCR